MINPFFISLFRLPKFVVTKILKHNQTYQPMKEKTLRPFRFCDPALSVNLSAGLSRGGDSPRGTQSTNYNLNTYEMNHY